MTKKDKGLIMDTVTETDTQEQPSTLLTITLFRFEDLAIEKDSSGTITINKALSGISDSTYATVAVGLDKNWRLLSESGQEIGTMGQHGNRPFYWEGRLTPGLYTLTAGPNVKNYSKHRIPGRGYKIQFRVM